MFDSWRGDHAVEAHADVRLLGKQEAASSSLACGSLAVVVEWTPRLPPKEQMQVRFLPTVRWKGSGRTKSTPAKRVGLHGPVGSSPTPSAQWRDPEERGTPPRKRLGPQGRERSTRSLSAQGRSGMGEPASLEAR